jgi:hypothetical protein
MKTNIVFRPTNGGNSDPSSTHRKVAAEALSDSVRGGGDTGGAESLPAYGHLPLFLRNAMPRDALITRIELRGWPNGGA